MQKAGAFITASMIAIYVFFTVFSALRGDETQVEGLMANGPQINSCKRKLAEVADSDEQAGRICNCMFREFDERGLNLLDAFGSDFDEMSAITQDCAWAHGVEVEPT